MGSRSFVDNVILDPSSSFGRPGLAPDAMKHKQSRNKKAAAIGMAWYRPQQWHRLRQVSADVEQLEESYYEWLSLASARFRDLQELGLNIRKVDVDVEDLLEWCKQRGRRVDGEARVLYVTEKIQQGLN